GKFINLVRDIGNKTRQISLFYFRAEAVTLYFNLFNKQSVAPRIICLKQCEDGFGGQNWTTFRNWHGPLGRLVQENRMKPELIVTSYDPPEYNWPWQRIWQEHPHWQGDFPAQLTSYALPGSLAASCGALRGSSDVPQEREGRIQLVLSTQPYNQGNAPDLSLSRDNFPSLGLALTALSATCQEHNIQDAHVIGCAFEDEGVAFSEWKKEKRSPRRLTI